MPPLDEIRKIKEMARLPKQKAAYRIPKKSAKKLKAEAEEKELRGLLQETTANFVEGIPGLSQWFEDRMKESLPVCMNCGMEANWLLQPEYKKIWKACQAHILPKRKTMFPSVATNPLNHMILFPVWGGHLCGCHDEYDSSWFNATAMKVWEIAVHRFKEFEDEIAPKERKNIPEQLSKLLDAKIL